MRIVTLVLVAAASAGCASGKSLPPASPRATEPAAQPPSIAPAPQAQSSAKNPCALRAAKTRVGAQLLDDGAALVFTTSDDVHALRQRVSDLGVIGELRDTRPRLDNVHGGVRLVFEAKQDSDVSALHDEIRQSAREISRRCGIVLGPPPERTRAQPSNAAPSKPGSVDVKPRKKAEPSKEPKPAPKGDKGRPKPKPSEAPPKAKPGDKTKPAEKPPAAKPPQKQPVPRLPGVHPEPLPGHD